MRQKTHETRFLPHSIPFLFIAREKRASLYEKEAGFPEIERAISAR